MADRLVGTGAPAPFDSAPPVRRNLLSRIKLGHVVMVLAAIVALVFNLAVLRGNEATMEVAIAAADIRAGTTLTMFHLETATIPADDLLATRFVPATDMVNAVGQLTTRSIVAGEPVLNSDLLVVENRGGLRAMSVPIDLTHAVAGHLSRGDSIDVVLVSDGVASFIATDIEVLEVPSVDDSALGARSGYAPTLAVDATQALLIASALDVGEVHIIRSTGTALPDLERATAVVGGASESASG
ncbi:MAG: hypothetical protein GY926_15520 [bacterium]|nr:hypothetical protein [bacterium]MCP4966624.1 hypothetical protein [bacterium]